MHDHPPYPVGLRLAGRPVVMVGAGHVAQRRVPALLAAGTLLWAGRRGMRRSEHL